MTEVALRVNGQEYRGWTSVRVTRGIETIAGGFELQVSDRWNGQTAPWPIMEEDECALLVNGRTLITGYVDRRRVSYGTEEHRLEVTGRDAAGALVDCSADLKSWEFLSIPLLALAKRLCDPFGISVALDSSAASSGVTLGLGTTGGSVSGAGKSGALGLGKPARKFTIDPGESPFEVLDRACRFAGVLPVSDGRGGVLLTRAGNSRADTALVEGENILSASAEYDASSRYRTYKVLAQHQGSDDFAGTAAASVSARATDPGVRRASRSLIVRAEANATPSSAQARAAWEAKVRAARGDTISVTVQGWTQASGALWPINALVKIQSPRLGVNGDMLITQTRLSLDEGGSMTHLSLMRPDAFIPEPVVRDTGLWKEIAKGA